MIRKAALALLSLAIVAAAVPAGTSHPEYMRQAWLGGTLTPAYYSIVEGGYRAITRPMRLAAN